jgi:hypothetical protein
MIKPHQTMFAAKKSFQTHHIIPKIPNHTSFRPQKSITITSEPSSHQTAG